MVRSQVPAAGAALRAGGRRLHGQAGRPPEALKQWGDEGWRTKDGSKSGGRKRYLPEAAWALLTKAEREATDRRKRGAEGQYEANTKAAKEARKALKLVDRKAGPARKSIAGADDAPAQARPQGREAGQGAQDRARRDRRAPQAALAATANTATSASTQPASNCVPAWRRSSATATSVGSAGR